MITPEYRNQLAQLHRERPDFGNGGAGQYDGRRVLELLGRVEGESVLDYGCGKGWIASQLPPRVSLQLYDPAMPEYSAPPEAADLVTCCDVMEHVEPELVGDVLAHIRQLSQKGAYFSIALAPAAKTLPDGRNAHICLFPPLDWLTQIAGAGFALLEFQCTGRWLTVLAAPNG